MIAPPAARSSIGLEAAEMKMSAGAPCAICAASVPEEPKLLTNVTFARLCLYAASASTSASFRLAAAETVRVVCAGQQHEAIEAANTMSAIPRQRSHQLLSTFCFDLTSSPCRAIDLGVAGLLAHFTPFTVTHSGAARLAVFSQVERRCLTL
jgi:hypothetical protein